MAPDMDSGTLSRSNAPKFPRLSHLSGLLSKKCNISLNLAYIPSMRFFREFVGLTRL